MKKKRIKHNYIDNKDLYDTIVHYKRHNDRASYEKLGRLFKLIADNMIKRANFSGYTCKDAMISDGIFYALKYFENFDEVKYTGAFSYITKIIYTAFVKRIKLEKHNINKRAYIFKMSGVETCFGGEDAEMISEYVKNTFDMEIPDEYFVTRTKHIKHIDNPLTRALQELEELDKEGDS